jgi:hypothetical protein
MPKKLILKMSMNKLRYGAPIILLALSICFIPFASAEAHRDGCHRWHSCESDTGSYVCGDLGNSSECDTENVPNPPQAEQTSYTPMRAQTVTENIEPAATETNTLGATTTNPTDVQNTNTNVDEIAANRPTNESNMLTKILYGALFIISALTAILIYLRIRAGMRNS